MVERESASAPSSEFQLKLVGARRIAKRLLQGMRRAGADPALARFHPRFEEICEEPKLADAQLIVARMFGYRSWPHLKHHLEELEDSQKEIDGHAPAPDGDRHTIHVRCGSDIQVGLQRAGYRGDFLEFADPLCQGPIVGDGIEMFLESRASFVAQAYGLELDACRQRLHREWFRLGGVEQFERVVLWFEGDSYDQLILAAVLARLAHQRGTSVQLICVPEYPGRPDYRGLGQLDEASLRNLWKSRRSLTEADYALGTAVWEALFRDDPMDLYDIASTGTPAIPAMAGALRRHLMELPWTTDGLSLTQRLALQALDEGAETAGRIFRIVTTELEPLPYLGDAMFWWELRELVAAGALTLESTDEPWPARGARISDLGKALLLGRGNYLGHAATTRWVGGVPCGPGGAGWRWEPKTQRPSKVGTSP